MSPIDFSTDAVFARLRGILCEILILNPEDVLPSSKLVDDLDADSIAFMELTFRIRSDFGLQVPEAKVDEETLTMPLLDGMARLEQKLSGTTLFEYMKQEATRAGAPTAIGLMPMFEDASQARARAQARTLAELAAEMGTSVPRGYDPDARLPSLQVRDLFRFITVEAYVRYIQSLAQSQQRIAAMGGAAAMNAGAAARLRAKPESNGKPND